MDPVSSVVNTGDLTRLLVGSATQQQTALVKKAVSVDAEQKAQMARTSGIGVVLDAVA